VEKILDVCKEVIPILLTGVITFLVTRYTQNRSVPLDKMEMSYNRIYYPLYKMLRNKKYKEINQSELRKKMDDILKKYDKYISQSTRNVYYDYIKNQDTDRPNKACFQNFQNNIMLYNSKLRYYLGYPQAPLWEMYWYIDKRSKRVFNVGLGIILLYIILMLQEIVEWEYYLYVCFVIILYISVTLLMLLLQTLSDITRKAYMALKRKGARVVQRVKRILSVLLHRDDADN